MRNISVLFMLITQIVISQKPVLKLNGKVSDAENIFLKGVEVRIESDDTLITVYTNENGKYKDINLKMGKLYTVTFAKKSFISISILIDTFNNYDENQISRLTTLDLPIELNSLNSYKKRKIPKSPMNLGGLKLDENGDLTIDVKFSTSKKKEYESVLSKAIKK